MQIDYVSIFKSRVERLNKLRGNPLLIAGAKEYYKTRPAEFITDWMITYDPRNASKKLPTTMPFRLFPRQFEYVNWLNKMVQKGESGSVEKCRDAGITEVSTAYTVWAWIFMKGASIGWGSRKEMLVDRLGDPDSIFEKIRVKIKSLPEFFLPDGLNDNSHFNYMKIVNPETGSTITGEAGTNIGRGGRKLIYFVDESAHCDKQEAIEAALGDNTNTQIHISSVNGQNLFYRRAKMNGGENTFIFDWKDDPRKSQEWYDKRKDEAKEKGVLHIFKQEVERDYLAAVEGIMIQPDWLRACVDAHKKLGFEASGVTQFGTDVSDEGGDIDAITGRKGSVIIHNENWNCAGDHDLSAGKSTNIAIEKNANMLVYDSIGVGAGFKTAIKHIEYIRFDIEGWNAGGAVVNPDERVYPDSEDRRTNKDFFLNAKAQGWWEVRERARKTYLTINNNKEYPEDELLSIDSSMVDRDKIENLIGQLSSPKMKYTNGKVRVESKQELKDREIESPNDADSVIMAFVDVKPKSFGTW